MHFPEKFEAEPGGALRTQSTCFACGRTLRSERTLTEAQLERIQAGGHVQNVLADWTPAEREFHFISGMCPRCWDEAFREAKP